MNNIFSDSIRISDIFIHSKYYSIFIETGYEYIIMNTQLYIDNRYSLLPNKSH